MRDISEIRRENLLKILEVKKLTRSELARLTGRTPQQISAISTGYKQIGTKLTRDIEKALNLETNYLDTDHNVEEIQLENAKKRIPILSWVQAGSPKETGDNDYSECLIVDDSVPEGCYALRVKGDSMFPEFNEGDLIVVNPKICKKPGDFVIARVCSQAGSCETTLKQYALVGVDEIGREVFELRPLNPMYAPLRSDRLQIEVVGVVIENRKKYR
nr:MAG TPA: SOS-response transcriptional repressors (RecA-mediated autopeptidases) [Caudoviricetes sp.]